MEVGVHPALGSEPRDRRFEDKTCLQPLQHAVEPDVEDEEAAVDLELDEPVAG